MMPESPFLLETQRTTEPLPICGESGGSDTDAIPAILARGAVCDGRVILDEDSVEAVRVGGAAGDARSRGTLDAVQTVVDGDAFGDAGCHTHRDAHVAVAMRGGILDDAAGAPNRDPLESVVGNSNVLDHEAIAGPREDSDATHADDAPVRNPNPICGDVDAVAGP